MQYYLAEKEHFAVVHFSQAQQMGRVSHLRLAQLLALVHSLSGPRAEQPWLHGDR